MQDTTHETKNPQNVSLDAINALYDEGNLLLCMEKYEEALVCYDRILEISPSSKRAAGYKGLALFKLKRHAEASQCYERALEFNKTD
ncbi:MAG: tetratricopeptide repeat protein [Nitrosotalea sp.]